MVNIGNDWDEILKDEFKKEYYQNLRKFLIEEYKEKTIYPPMNDIFNCLKYSSYIDTKVVILGQDPYHQVGQAHGLCFSVNKGIKIPASLINIYKELESDLNIKAPSNGDLSSWAKQGVLLLNATLTVRDSSPLSHKGKGWEELTDYIIKKLNDKETPIVFILWGNSAKEKIKYITNPIHLVLTGAHPSPLSAYNGFFNGKYFSRANNYLKLTNQKEIDWELKE